MLRRVGYVLAAFILTALVVIRDSFERQLMAIPFHYLHHKTSTWTLDDEEVMEMNDNAIIEPSEKDWIENCVPYHIISQVEGIVATVTWRTHRLYKMDDFDKLVECGSGKGQLQYRQVGSNDYIEVPSVLEYGGSNITIHTASFTVNATTQYDFIVGSSHHGYSSRHRLGENIDYLSQDEYYCRPVRIHTAYGSTPDTFTIQWATNSSCTLGDNILVVQEGSDDNFNLTQEFTAHSFTFGIDRLEHVAYAKNLKSNTQYSYYVGNPAYSRSIVYSFTTPRGVDDMVNAPPLRILITGDIGYQNAATLPMMQSEVARGDIDAVVSVGDYAYDLHNNKGMVGDIFMSEIEPIAANVPFMVAMGNHEAKDRFVHYTNRFQLMPANAGTVVVKGQELSNNWFYSYNVGLVHFVVLNTEIYFRKHKEDPNIIDKQLQWLESDLLVANGNRTASPWIIVIGHRPLYCTSDEQCDQPATTLRNAFEDIFYKYGVDIYICGHEHNYERMYGIYRGSTDQRTYNMRATTHILIGTAGQSKVLPVHKPFLRQAEPWDAFRNNIFGYSRLEIMNATHLHWQQIECDPINPAASHLNGKAIDDVWLVQESHGSFSNL
ncbi:calcineurin-like phosphoesterase [Thraustotheca clavata]|uniref:Purple acid phosphatase n=1 Tax=Thraustotheca clavata TaxID=74557 RepID=A0A1V9Y8T8_9STRA|nr:calcineurin-like phosphoesterase [Thraustotheca clavata]